MKINLFKKKNNFKKKNFEINPIFCWQIAIFIMMIAIIAFFIFGYYLWRQIKQESVLSSTDTVSQVGQVDKNRIEKILNLFSQKAQTSNEILSSPTPVVDPSL